LKLTYRKKELRVGGTPIGSNGREEMNMHENLIQAIEKDHKEVQGILKKIKNMGDGKPKERKEMFETLKMELIPHMKAEESAFYPKLKEKK
jgi:iron-sulfur cluster repair protein YtfE (RIC family)